MKERTNSNIAHEFTYLNRRNALTAGGLIGLGEVGTYFCHQAFGGEWQDWAKLWMPLPIAYIFTDITLEIFHHNIRRILPKASLSKK